MEKRTILFSPPDISDLEIEEVIKTLQSGWITTGPRTKLLERRLAAYIETGRVDIDCDTPENIEKYKNRVVCLNSATAAEELNLRILGIGSGDEVIVPAYTYTASASAAIHCGATVKFVDIQKNGDPVTHAPEMDYEKLEAAITKNTKAIIPVDIGGILCDYSQIYQIIERKRELFIPSGHTKLGQKIQEALGRIAVVSDCAHALGSKKNGVHAGAIADFSSFSFHAVKNFTTGEGGASTWREIEGIQNEEIYTQYQLLSLHGQDKDALEKTRLGAWEYDIIAPWYKCNMTDIMAAIGLKQLERYPKLLARRKEIIEQYDTVCEELNIEKMVHYNTEVESCGHLYMVRIPWANHKLRCKIIGEMAEYKIACNVHYKPLPMMTAYKTTACGEENSWNIKDFPNSYKFYENEITLPLHTKLSDNDVLYIVETFKKVVEESKREVDRKSVV